VNQRKREQAVVVRYAKLTEKGRRIFKAIKKALEEMDEKEGDLK